VIDKVEFSPVFPVFYKFYDEHPFGKVTLRNTGNTVIDNATVSLFIKQYMDAPKVCATGLGIESGQSVTTDLYALFTMKVLDISEATKSTAQVTVSYTAGGQSRAAELADSVRLYDRNALCWDDDRKASAFVSGKDPSVMRLAKNVASIIKDKACKALNKNLLSAMALHEALMLYGLSYVVDPSASYATNVTNPLAVDYLQYPRQTLEFKAGDCDDLSILYASLLESLGVETAFITVPGHIFVAFSLDMAPAEARSQFQAPDELILTQDASWVPVEVTELSADFLTAWKTGAKEWRENSSNKQAKLYPIHDAWKIYDPVGFPGDAILMTLPDSEKTAVAFIAEQERFIDQEIFPEVAKLQVEITRAQGSPQSLNKLGVLYGRYGLNDRAEAQFKQAISGQEYGPALLNLGNVFFLKGRMDDALEYYTRAQKCMPDNAKVLLALARVNHAIENYAIAKAAYDKLKTANPALAAQFSYLSLRGEEAGRAADLSDVKDVVVWEE
jgi:tetratricopeptide (TPR) repeat protein